MELRLANERIKMLQAQVDSLKERIRDLETDKGFLLDQIKEKDGQIAERDKIIGELIPRALPKPKTTIGDRFRHLFKRGEEKTT